MPKFLRQPAGSAILGIVFALLVVSCGEAPPTRPTPPPPPPPPPGSMGPIAFVSTREGSPAIYVANEDGSNVTRLVAASVALTYPAWSPDGRRLAFARQLDGVYVINVDGSGLRKIWSRGTTSYPSYPVDWSPDGSKIAFMDCCGTDTGIFVIDSNGSDVTRLIGHEFAGPGCKDVMDTCGVYSPTWSPDGQQIAFAYWGGYCCGLSGVAIINVDGTLPRFLRPADGGSSPAWSPDGTKIAFQTGFFGGLSGEIGFVSADGSGRPQFLQISGEDPRWTPDGSIIFSARTDADRRRVFISTGTGPRRQLIPEANAPANPGYEDCCAVWAR
jgi:Tol biopolymer transport system component